MTPGSTIVRGAFYSGAGMVVMLAGGMVTLKFITNAPSLNESAVGAFAMLTILSEFLVIFNNLGLRSSLPKLVAGAAPAQRTQIVAASLGYQALLSCVAGGALLAVWAWAPLDRLVPGNAAWLYMLPFLGIVPALMLASSMREVLLAVLAGRHAYGRRVVGLTLYSAVQVALVAGLVWFARSGLMALLAASLAAHAVAAAALFLMMPERVRPGLAWPPYRDAIRFGWPLYVNNLFGFVFQRVDTLFIGALLGPAAAGLFEMGAKRIPYYISSILNAALVPFLPSLSERVAADDRAGALRLLAQTYSTSAFLSYLAAFAVLALQAPLIRLLFSGLYLAGGAALGLMMVAAALALQAGIMGQALIALGRPHIITAVNIGLAGFSLLFNALLIPRYGVLGAGYAAVLAAAFSFALQTCYARARGLPLPLWAVLGPHVAMILSLACAFALGGRAPAWLLAGTGFVTLAFLFRIVTWRQLRAVYAVLGSR